MTINSDESCDIFLANSDTAVGKILSNELKSTELCQKIKKYCHSARNINSQINWNLVVMSEFSQRDQVFRKNVE